MPVREEGYEILLWGEFGSLLQTVGQALQTSPAREVRHFGEVLEQSGRQIVNSDMAGDAMVDATTGTYTPAEAAGDVAAIVAGAAMLGFLGTIEGTLFAAVVAGTLGISSPFWLAIVAGAVIWGGTEIAGAAVQQIAEEISDLVVSIMADPIVLDLDGDGIELTALVTSTTVFDLDNDGYAERTGWVGPHDGLLVHDANGRPACAT